MFACRLQVASTQFMPFVAQGLIDLISKSNKCFYEIFDCYNYSRLGLLSFAHDFEHSTHQLDVSLSAQFHKETCREVSQGLE